MSKYSKDSKITKFRFSMGGFSQGTILLDLVDNSIVQKRNGWSEGVIYTPTQDDWNTFSDSLRKLGLWNWEREYLDPLVMDGTQWELSIKEGTRKKSCYGSNDYPPGFVDFIRSVNQLVNDDVFSE